MFKFAINYERQINNQKVKLKQSYHQDIVLISSIFFYIIHKLLANALQFSKTWHLAPSSEDEVQISYDKVKFKPIFQALF